MGVVVIISIAGRPGEFWSFLDHFWSMSWGLRFDYEATRGRSTCDYCLQDHGLCTQMGWKVLWLHPLFVWCFVFFLRLVEGDE